MFTAGRRLKLNMATHERFTINLRQNFCWRN